MTNSVCIIGAGPAGMTAALFATHTGERVRLIDGNPIVGRKLSVTGSGRANLTNQHADARRYTCADQNWMQALLGQFGYSHLIRFLETIGVLTYSTPDGWCYPVSESAKTVVDAFENALKLAKVELVLNSKVTDITKSKQGFSLKLESGSALNCERLIVAAGGKAYPSLGSRGELFDSLKELGHAVIPLSPALGPVTCEMKAYKKLFGVRLDACVSLYSGSKLLEQATGNLIFTQWGLNGPAVMDLSHHISKHTFDNLELRINPLFAFEHDLKALFQKQHNTPTSVRVLLGAVLPPKMPPVLLSMVGLPEDIMINQVNDTQIKALFHLLTTIPFKVTGVRGFDYCQATIGGVPVSEVDPLTMRSRIIHNLALAGETLDAVGPCGGYNLQFAFSSGAVAGMHISE
jgi:predicted Rossmann fold flavoprotein